MSVCVAGLEVGYGIKQPHHCELVSVPLQMLEVAYLLYCGRYFYPVLILGLLMVSGYLLIRTLRLQRKKIKALVNECRLTPLVWDGWVRAISSHRLLPGDVMVLQQGKALCDMVVLQGTCLVVESMLSGEVSLCACTGATLRPDGVKSASASKKEDRKEESLRH